MKALPSLLCTLALVLSLGVARAEPAPVRLQLPTQATQVSEQASCERHEQLVYAPKGSMPGRSSTSKRRLELEFVRVAGGVEVSKARRWAPQPKKPRPPGPAAAPRPMRAKRPGETDPKEVLVETTLPCEGKRVALDRLKPTGEVVATIEDKKVSVHPALAWELEHSLQALLPQGQVALGETWSPPPTQGARALLGAQAWGQIAKRKIKESSLEAKLESATPAKTVVSFTLRLSFAAPKRRRTPGMSLDFAASLEASGTLTLAEDSLRLELAGSLKVKKHYSSGAPPDAKIDVETTLDRALAWKKAP